MFESVCITGSKGQLGNDCFRVFKNIAQVYGIGHQEVDLSDREDCFSALDQIRPDIIVNCAAYTAVDACESDPSCWRANQDLPGNLAEWTEVNDAFLIHVSTDYVFSGDRPLFEVSVESDPAEPISEYGKSKLAGEQMIANKTNRFAILRTAWLYGAYGDNFLKTMLRLTLQNPGKDFKIVDDQWGSPTWSLSLARQICEVVEKKSTGIFHASSEGYCTWFDLACAFLNELNLKHNFIPCCSDEFPTPSKRPSNSILENAHAKQLGINVFSDWRIELQHYVEMCGNSLVKEVDNL